MAFFTGVTAINSFNNKELEPTDSVIKTLREHFFLTKKYTLISQFENKFISLNSIS